jgi:hypothetical protein
MSKCHVRAVEKGLKKGANKFVTNFIMGHVTRTEGIRQVDRKSTTAG